MLELVQIPVWRDNYAYLAHDGARAFVVDPPEAAPVLDRLEGLQGVSLAAVVNTHHHPDHVGGNLGLVEKTGCAVIGAAHDADRIPGITRQVEIGELIEVAGIELEVLDVRAHTRAHIAYRSVRAFERIIRHGHDGAPAVVSRLQGRPVLFVGDSLFLGGCGRLFEGTPSDLDASMRLLSTQSPQSLVCCAHEYTASNLRFAAHVMPSHDGVRRRLEGLEDERSESGSSVPDTLERELRTNPFLLALQPGEHESLAASMDLAPGDTVALLGALRSAKDRF